MSTLLWILLSYLIIGIVLTFAIGKFGKAKWALVFLAAYFLVPFGDQIAGTVYLKYLCKTQAQRTISKTVDDVSGFIANGRNMEPSKAKPYQFIENESSSGKVTRVSVLDDGRILRKDGVKPISRYRYREGPRAIGPLVEKYERLIEDLHTAEVLAIETTFIFAGGWLWRRLLGGYGTSQHCVSEPRLDVMLPEVLKPARATQTPRAGS